MQQFASPEQQAAFMAIMGLKDRERASWANVITLRGDDYARAQARHLTTFKYPREEAWEAYSKKYLGGASLTKMTPTREAWRRKVGDKLADVVATALKG